MSAVPKNKIDEFHEHLNKQIFSIQFTKNGKIPFPDCLVMRKQHPTNHWLQETNTHWQTTWPNVLQSYFTQSDYGANTDRKSTNCLRLRRQVDRPNQAFEHGFC